MLEVSIDEEEDGYRLSVLDMRSGGGCWEEPIAEMSEEEALSLADELITAMNKSVDELKLKRNLKR